MGETEKLNSFRIVGLITSPNFQRCKAIVEKLTKSYPDVYTKADVRPMLNVSWIEYLIKMRQRIGGKLWELTKPVMVYLNGDYMGDDDDLDKFIAKNYRFTITKDFECIGAQHLQEFIKGNLAKKRKFVYLSITIEEVFVGSLLFLLYADMVPITCENFIKRCVRRTNGYLGTKAHRIAYPSWVQFGGFSLTEHKMADENFTVFHDRRGVLSMANAGRHKENSAQFHVALNPTPWMDYKYVAFGQLIHGEEVLRAIEVVPTHYESPLKEIRIVKCGEFSLDTETDLAENEREVFEAFLKSEKAEEVSSPSTPKPSKSKIQQVDEGKEFVKKEVLDVRDVDSSLYEQRYNKGLYGLETDSTSYKPFLQLPDYAILDLLKEQVDCENCIDTDFLYPQNVLLNELKELECGLPGWFFKKCIKAKPAEEESEGEEEGIGMSSSYVMRKVNEYKEIFGLIPEKEVKELIEEMDDDADIRVDDIMDVVLESFNVSSSDGGEGSLGFEFTISDEIRADEMKLLFEVAKDEEDLGAGEGLETITEVPKSQEEQSLVE